MQSALTKDSGDTKFTCKMSPEITEHMVNSGEVTSSLGRNYCVPVVELECMITSTSKHY